MKIITSDEFDIKFDSGEDISEHLDQTKIMSLNVDLPKNILKLTRNKERLKHSSSHVKNNTFQKDK